MDSADGAAAVDIEINTATIQVADHHSAVDIRCTVHEHCSPQNDHESIEGSFTGCCQISCHHQNAGSAESGAHVAIALNDVDLGSRICSSLGLRRNPARRPNVISNRKHILVDLLKLSR